MKKIMVTSLLLLGLTLAVQAQQKPAKAAARQKTSVTHQKTSISEHAARAHLTGKNYYTPAPASKKLINERKVYTWPDGQRATYSVHQAMGINDDETSLKKDSAWQMYLKQHPENKRADSAWKKLKGR